MAKKKPSAKQEASQETRRTVSALTGKLAIAEGRKATATQRRDITWLDKQAADQANFDAYTKVPKGIFCAMAARQQKVIDEQADRYDLPIDGATIDLYEAIKAYHDLIVANGRFIRPADDAESAGEMDLDEAAHHDLQTEKLRQEVIKLRQSNERLGIMVVRDRGDSIDRRELREMLTWLSTRLEGLGAQLRASRNGEEASKSLNEFLDQLADEAEHGALRF